MNVCSQFSSQVSADGAAFTSERMSAEGAGAGPAAEAGESSAGGAGPEPSLSPHRPLSTQSLQTALLQTDIQPSSSNTALSASFRSAASWSRSKLCGQACEMTFTCAVFCGQLVVAATCGAFVLLLCLLVYAFTCLFLLFTLPLNCCCSCLYHLLTLLGVTGLFRFNGSSSRRNSALSESEAEGTWYIDKFEASLQIERDIDL